MLTHLLIMRHAKSSWDDPDATDHQRPLNKRGRRAATAVGEALTARGYAPERIWSSDAKRTRETAMRLIRAIPGAQRVDYFPDLYHVSPRNMLDVARREGEPDCERLMWLGHNPGWAELAERFSGMAHAFPTGACLVLKRNGGEWLEPASWRAVDFLLPRDLDT